jgi:S-formylglutathione hydrolase FrmB
MRYRVLLPVEIPAGQSLPVVYLLHGNGGDFRDWSNDSGVSSFAQKGLILVMPEGDSSYYVNSATRPEDRYEDYIVSDLIADVDSKFPANRGRSSRAVVGVSMGGFGAIKLALSHPNLFSFVGGISPAIDVPSRPFSVKRISQWRQYSSIFGAWGSQTRHDRDPFVLARSVNPQQVPYLYLSCGEQEGLMPANRKFAELLAGRHFKFEFRPGPGSHDWNQWNQRLASVFQSMVDHGH